MANNTTWRRIEVAAFVVAAVFAVDATAQEATRPKPIDDPDSYAVYASLLPNQWTVRSAKAKTLVFQQETTTDSHCLPSGPPLDGSWREVMDGFRRENASAR